MINEKAVKAAIQAAAKRLDVAPDRVEVAFGPGFTGTWVWTARLWSETFDAVDSESNGTTPGAALRGLEQ